MSDYIVYIWSEHVQIPSLPLSQMSCHFFFSDSFVADFTSPSDITAGTAQSPLLLVPPLSLAYPRVRFLLCLYV